MGRTKEITDRAHNHYIQERLAQTIELGCTFCDWRSGEGVFGDVRVLAVAHRKAEHPDARQRTKRARNRGGIKTIGTRTIGENIANVRAQGGAAWASEEYA